MILFLRREVVIDIPRYRRRWRERNRAFEHVRLAIPFQGLSILDTQRRPTSEGVKHQSVCSVTHTHFPSFSLSLSLSNTLTHTDVGRYSCIVVTFFLPSADKRYNSKENRTRGWEMEKHAKALENTESKSSF